MHEETILLNVLWNVTAFLGFSLERIYFFSSIVIHMEYVEKLQITERRNAVVASVNNYCNK